MKKRILSSFIAIFMVISFLQVTAFAYTPTSPGLWIETGNGETGVKFAITPNVSGYHDPDNAAYKNNNAILVSNQNNKTVTVNVPYNATFIMFRYWDYGNPTSTGWTTGGTVSRKINGVSTSSYVVGGNGTDDKITSGGRGVANRWYVAFSADNFTKVNGTDTFTVDVVRTVSGVRYSYTITYNINWIGSN